MKHCAPCHGDDGEGDGRHAATDLSPPPADLAAAAFQAGRSDETLSRTIGEGTAKMGRSNLCPPWGRTLSKEDIRWLVRFARTLRPAEPPAGQP